MAYDIDAEETPGRQICDLILTRVKGFSDSSEYEALDSEDRLVAGLVCAALAGLLQRFELQVMDKQLTDPEAQTLSDIYQVVEELSASTDPTVQNYVVTEIFENLSDESAEQAVVRRLGPRSKELYDRWM